MLKNLSFRTRVILTIAFAAVLATTSAVVLSAGSISKEGEQALVEKSRAILSRLEVGGHYVAEMDTLQGVIKETVKAYPDGRLAEDVKLRILKNVPIFAAMEIGRIGAEKEHYQFRVASDNARKKENAATPEEKQLLDKFRADPTLKEWVETTSDGRFVKVTRPVHLSEKTGCLTCHGSPRTSPWGNGKDILGYELEDMKDGDLKGMFTITSELAPVQAQVRASTTELAVFGFAFTLLALLVGYFAMRGPLTSLGHLVTDLDSAATELSTAADQISQVSQTLSVNASQSAKAIESTASAIEEISSTASTNADSAKQAALLAQASKEEAGTGEREIQALIASMTEIASSSRKIEEITSVIDDIAFQTNLLALNAAVEAARAGEQGKGFGVVAEAVRTLAARSAAAAKDIESLIKDSVAKADHGKAVADRSGEVLKRIVESANKASTISAEIAQLSSDQANGINHVGQAMSEVDSSTQKNAESSEETSASAEEISSQAAVLKDLVADLVKTLNGRRNGGSFQGRDRGRRGPGTGSRGMDGHRGRAAEIIPLGERRSVRDEEFAEDESQGTGYRRTG